MARTTFSNTAAMLSVWLQMSQERGRTSSASFWGRELLSYGTHVASVVDAADGKATVIVSPSLWSTTTAAFLSAAVGAARDAGFRVFRAPAVSLSGSAPTDAAHAKNEASYRAEVADLDSRRTRGRSTSVDTYTREIAGKVAEANAYAEAFGLSWRLTAPEYQPKPVA